MHARNRTWLLGSDPVERCRQRTLPVEGGDGSTLSLDFTTGVLDPRLTFTRASDATFINSQGFVQYADANHVANSVFSGAGTGNAPTNWSGSVGVNLTIPSAGTRRAETTTAAQNWIGSPAFATQIGITYSTSVLVTSVSGQHYANTLTVTGSPTLVGYYLNGSSVGQFSTASAGLITIVWTATTIGSHAVRIGIGCTGANISNGVCEFTLPRSVPGNFTQPAYFANSSTTAGYYGPRFDHDPTTRAPRGLLIEGQSVNSVNWSESFATSGSGTLWNYNTYVTRNATQITGPDGGTSAYQFNETTDNQIHRISTSVTGSAGAISISVWAKVLDTNTPRRLYVNAANYMGAGALFDLDPAVQTGASGSAVATSGTAANRAGTWVKYPNNWYRVTLVGTYVTNQTIYLQINRASSTTATDDTFAGSTSNGLALWGCQVEQGSGASSYIPTGASQGTRNVDNCELLNLTTMGFNASAGTIYVDTGTRIGTGGRSYSFMPTSGINDQIFEGGGFLLNVYSSGTFVAQIGTGTASAAKIAAAYAVNDYAVSVNGGAPSTDTAGALPTTIAKLTIGARDSSSVTQMNGCIRVFKYWPTRLPNAQLQSITT